jgi:hypothetical protein
MDKFVTSFERPKIQLFQIAISGGSFYLRFLESFPLEQIENRISEFFNL